MNEKGTELITDDKIQSGITSNTTVLTNDHVSALTVRDFRQVSVQTDPGCPVHQPIDSQTTDYVLLNTTTDYSRLQQTNTDHNRLIQTTTDYSRERLEVSQSDQRDVAAAADLQRLEAVREVAQVDERRVLQVAAVVEADLTQRRQTLCGSGGGGGGVILPATFCM